VCNTFYQEWIIKEKGCFMPNNKLLCLLGYASGIAGAEPGSADGPVTIQESPYLNELTRQGIQLKWSAMIKTPRVKETSTLALVRQQCSELAEAVAPLVQQKQMFTVIGGDHTSAIGTWSGVFQAIHKKGSFGLLWIDAHMDSHTPESSQSGNLHGMPLACLLGEGESSLVTLMGESPKLNPENVCLIGIRSFEQGEMERLKRLNVRVFYMDEVKQRGLSAVFAEAIEIVSKNTVGYGVSIDVDSIDPIDAPGTGVSEPGGIPAADLCAALTTLAQDPRLIGIEIAEFDPHFDREQRTEKLIVRFIIALTLGKIY
jgi:arginase